MLSLIIEIILTINYEKNRFDVDIKNKMDFLTKYTIEDINHIIEDKKNIFTLLLQSRAFDVYSNNEQVKMIEELFYNFNDKLPIIYFLDKNNNVITYNNTIIDTHKTILSLIKKESEHTKLSKDEDTITISDIKYSKELNKPIIILSLAKKTYFDEEIGTIYAVTPLDVDFTDNIKINNHFVQRILDSNNNILMSSNKDEVTKNLLVNKKLQSNVVAQSNIMGVDSFYFMYKEKNITTLISLPYQYFKDIIYAQIIHLITIYALIIFLTITVITFVSKNITAPISKLLEQIKSFSKSDYSKKIDIDSNDEIGILANSFNLLGDELYKHKEELLEINKNLENTIKIEVEKNIHKKELLLKQSRSAALGEMMDAIAHQWKQPLSAITMYTSSLKLENMLNQNVLSQSIDYTTNEIENRVNHLLETIDEFRQFFRPTLKKELVNIKELINSVLELDKDLLINNNINVQIDCNEEIEYKLVPTLFKHVFINLISNAKDAFIENNIKFKKLIFKIRRNTTNITINVIDNAGGIPEDILDKIFEANITTKKEGKGTGIGLYMSKEIMQKLEGDISVENIIYEENTLEKGAMFTITLPIKI